MKNTTFVINNLALKIIYRSLITILIFTLAHIVVAQEEMDIGKSIFSNECASCHDGGFWGWLYGAPQIGVQNEWEEFLSKGVPELVDAAIKGTEGGMDPKGGCDDCSNEEIKAAVEYIVSQTQK